MRHLNLTLASLVALSLPAVALAHHHDEQAPAPEARPVPLVQDDSDSSKEEEGSETSDGEEESEEAGAESPTSEGENPTSEGDVPGWVADPSPDSATSADSAPDIAPEAPAQTDVEPPVQVSPEASAESPSKPTPPEWLTSSEPIVFRLPGEVTLTPVAQVQARVTVFDEDDSERNDPVVYGDPGLSEGVSLRRVRLGLKANWRDVVGLSIVGGFDNRYDYTEPFGHNAKLTEATFSLTPLKEVGVTVGLTKVAFGRQAVTSSAHLALWERAMVSEHMAPDREAGVYLAGSFGPEDNKVLGENAVNWAFGVSNGGGDWTGDFDASPRLAGRLSLDLGAPWEDVESAWSQTGFGLSVGGSLSHNWGLEADSLLAGVDLGIRVGRFGLQGEFMVGNAVPTFDTEGIPSQLAERGSLGGYGQVVFAILPGNLEATFRAGAYDDNVALDDAGDRLDLAGGINAYLLGGRLKAQLNFVHRMELTETAVTSNDSLILQVQARL